MTSVEFYTNLIEQNEACIEAFNKHIAVYTRALNTTCPNPPEYFTKMRMDLDLLTARLYNAIERRAYLDAELAQLYCG